MIVERREHLCVMLSEVFVNAADEAASLASQLSISDVSELSDPRLGWCAG